MSSIRVRVSFETVRLQALRSGSQGCGCGDAEEFTSRSSYEPNYGPEGSSGTALGAYCRPLTLAHAGDGHQ